MIVIEGVRKPVSDSRTRCFVCKPFGKRGRTSSGPVVKSMANYHNWPDEWKKTHQSKVRDRANGKKEYLVALKGGACKECGYQKSLRALTFHHRDPSTKKFGLDKESILRQPWPAVLEEVEKCDLLCSNCHCEAEDEVFLKNSGPPGEIRTLDLGA